MRYGEKGGGGWFKSWNAKDNYNISDNWNITLLRGSKLQEGT